jgi:hypothetical protein
MAENHVLLETIELSQSAASITFDNIPQTGYTDLKIVISARGLNAAATNDSPALQFNGDTANNYSYRRIFGTGSATGSDTTGNNYAYTAYTGYATATANTFGNSQIYIPNYSVSGIQKSISSDGVSENNSSTAYMAFVSNIWTGTAAISSINIAPVNGTGWTVNSTFSLYGIAALGTTPTVAPKATGGNIIENDGTYWIHTFTSSGTFTPQTELTCDYLVVAGGGGASADAGGGGGAGGYRTSIGGSPLSILATPYAVTVGAGGVGGIINVSDPTAGSSSIFSTITSAGGGLGGRGAGLLGGAGGSGGGGSGRGQASGTFAGGTATPSGQGNNGGSGVGNASGQQAAGGGGGAGAAGANASAGFGGNGGNGLANSISGTSVTYAGGGGGGILNAGNVSVGNGGSGGGGNANNSGGAGSNGGINLGGGGGGSTYNPPNSNGGAGGSGIVIIRYPIA